MIEDPVITIADMRPLYCVNGVRKAFAAADLDFRHFIKHGARASELRGHGYDAVIDRVVASMRSRETS